MLSVKNISFSYSKSQILSGISLSVKQGDYLAIVGESGSGKSTLLKLIYGEYDLDEGKILWNGSAVLGPKDKLVVGHGFMKYVAQEFDLMPFTTVSENIGTHLSNFYPKEKEKRIKELLKVVELEEFSSTKVKLLSGGQKQRVALAKAIAKQPSLSTLQGKSVRRFFQHQVMSVIYVAINMFCFPGHLVRQKYMLLGLMLLLLYEHC